jgi:hypothetical protein
MATPYYPDPNADTPRGNARKAIVSTTNATPIKIEVTGHGWNTGDQVEIEGATDPNANGTWSVTFFDANHVTLDGSVGTLAGGAVGTASNWTVLPNSNMFDDGEAVDSATLGGPIENVTNFVPFANMRAGRWRTVDIYHAEHADAGGPLALTVWSNTNLPGTNAWVRPQNNPLLTFSVPPVGLLGDVLDITIATTFIQSAGAARIPIGVALYGAGGAVTIMVPGSQFLPPVGYDGPITLRGSIALTTVPLTTGVFNVGAVLFDLPAGGAVTLCSDWQCFVRHLRANP